MGDSDDDFLGGLALLLGLGILLLGGAIICALAAWVWENREEIGQILLRAGWYIVALLLAPQYVVAWFILSLCRDRVVHDWPADYGEREERLAILIWTVGIPVVSVPLWFLLVSVMLILVYGFGGLILGILSTVAFAGCYYYIYVEKPPKHYNWPLFAAQQQKIRFAVKCEYLVQRLRLKLAWLDFKRKTKMAEMEDGHKW